MTTSLQDRFRRGLNRKDTKRLSLPSVLSSACAAVILGAAAFAGWGAAAGLDAWFGYRNLGALELLAASPTDPLVPVDKAAGAGAQLSRFTQTNPFRADVPARAGNSPSTTVAPEQSGTSLGDLTLTGTLPPEGAFFQSPEGLVLLLRGDSVEGYELVEVRPEGVLFQKGEEEVFLNILFSGNSPVASTRQPSQPLPQAAPQHSVQPAEPGKEGALDRELVNQLLMNPFEELKKLRLRPRMENGEAVGIEVRYIRKDSIFKQLGVERGDVIQGVNGIEMKNMNDVANFISSLMGGSRFDVTVIRNGKPETLSYTVR